MPAQDKVWFLTGCSTGFGRVMTEELLKLGARVTATARRPESLQDLAAAYPETLQVLALDVTDHCAIAECTDASTLRWGRIDVLFNNAGYGLIGGIEEPTWEEIRAQFETNVFGAAEVIRQVLPVMRRQGSGHILNISSIVGLVAYSAGGWYAATKHALEAISESLSYEVKPLGIKVTSVQPGPFRTNFAGSSLKMAERSMPDYEATVGARRKALKEMDGAQIGDPVRACHAMMKVVEAENPPLHLVLGSYAFQETVRYTGQLLSEVSSWRAEAFGSDFPENER